MEYRKVSSDLSKLVLFHRTGHGFFLLSGSEPAAENENMRCSLIKFARSSVPLSGNFGSQIEPEELIAEIS